MSYVDQISAPLKRQIKPGKEYEKLFPRVNCATTNLGDGSNNTFEGVEFMAEWVTQYAYQTVKIAKKLQGANLAETVNNIASWLYWHIQYQADGQLQQLRSPACAFKKRKEGIDCKSFTIFAMAMLQNLGITAAIRQVRQNGGYDDLWTHVYVVVPKNQRGNFKKQLNQLTNYYVIDPTKHDYNSEVSFIEKNDKIMQQHKYVGMNAPGTVATVTQPLTPKEYENGKQLKHELQTELGYSAQTVNKMFAIMYGWMENGIPKDQIIFHPGKTGIHIKPSATVKGYLFDYPNRGLNGNDAGEVVSAGGKVAEGDYFGAAQDILETGWFQDTIGGFLANGWDFGCINTWYSPAEAKEDVAKDFPFMIEFSGLHEKGEVTSEKLNRFLNIWGLYNGMNTRQSKEGFARCTTEGLLYAVEAAKKFKEKVINDIKSYGYTIQTVAKNQPINVGKMLIDYPGRRGIENKFGFTYDKVKVIPPKTSKGSPDFSGSIPATSSGKGNIIGGIFDKITKDKSFFPSTGKGGGNVAVSVENLKTKGKITSTGKSATTTKTASFGLVALGAGILLWPSIKKALNNNTNQNQSTNPKKPKSNAKK